MDAAAVQTGGHPLIACAQAGSINETCGRIFTTSYGDWNHRLRLRSAGLSSWHKHSHTHVALARKHIVHSSDAHRMHTHRMHNRHRMHTEHRHAQHVPIGASSSVPQESSSETRADSRSSRSNGSSRMRRGGAMASATTTTTEQLMRVRVGHTTTHDRIAAQDRRRAAHVVAEPVGIKAPVRGVPAGVLHHKARRALIEKKRFGNYSTRTNYPTFGLKSVWHRVML